MRIIKISAAPIVPPNPGGTATENIRNQIQNINNMIPVLTKFQEIASVANDLHAKAAEIGNTLGIPGLADQVLQVIQTGILQTADFKSLVQMGVLGSVQEMFDTGLLNQKITLLYKQVQEASAAGNAQPSVNPAT